jgi:antitoxin ParD1/3/4
MGAAEKISVTVTPDMLRELRESVEAGDYASTSEALRDAVRIWRRQRLEDSERLASIRARIDRSLADPRPSLSAREAADRMDEFFQRMAKNADA